MDDDLIWRMRHRQMEASLRGLCEEALADGRVDRLQELNRSLQVIEREILDAAQVIEQGEKARKPFWPFLRRVMGHLAEAYCRIAFYFQWDAAEIRVRLKGEEPK